MTRKLFRLLLFHSSLAQRSVPSPRYLDAALRHIFTRYCFTRHTLPAKPHGSKAHCYARSTVCGVGYLSNNSSRVNTQAESERYPSSPSSHEAHAAHLPTYGTLSIRASSKSLNFTCVSRPLPPLALRLLRRELALPAVGGLIPLIGWLPPPLDSDDKAEVQHSEDAEPTSTQHTFSRP